MVERRWKEYVSLHHIGNTGWSTFVQFVSGFVWEMTLSKGSYAFLHIHIYVHTYVYADMIVWLRNLYNLHIFMTNTYMYVHSLVGGRYVSWHVSSSFCHFIHRHVSVAFLFITVRKWIIVQCVWHMRLLLLLSSSTYLHHMFMKRRENPSLGSRHVYVSLIILLNVLVY